MCSSDLSLTPNMGGTVSFGGSTGGLGALRPGAGGSWSRGSSPANTPSAITGGSTKGGTQGTGTGTQNGNGNGTDNGNGTPGDGTTGDKREKQQKSN